MGHTPPDLKQLLGDSYKSDYDMASQSPRQRGRKASAVHGSHVVVETWGHMRKLQGRAYDPALIPTGVSAHEIQ